MDDEDKRPHKVPQTFRPQRLTSGRRKTDIDIGSIPSNKAIVIIVAIVNALYLIGDIILGANISGCP